MNEAGIIVGVFSEGIEERGFVRQVSGKITIVDVPAAAASSPLGLNNTGQFVGFFGDDSGIHGYLWNGTGEFLPIDFPGMAFTVPLDITDDGCIVGYYVDANEHIHGFLARPADANAHVPVEKGHNQGLTSMPVVR